MAGLLVGSALMGNPFRVLGISVQQSTAFMIPNILQKVGSAAALLGLDLQPESKDIMLDDRWIGPGYAVLTPECVDAMKHAARAEGIVLDPVYTSKALAGVLGRIREGSLTSEDTVVFLHTGGTPAIFAFADQLGAAFREESGDVEVVRE